MRSPTLRAAVEEHPRLRIVGETPLAFDSDGTMTAPWALAPDLLTELQEIADMVPFRPFEEPFSLPFGRPEPVWPGPAR